MQAPPGGAPFPHAGGPPNQSSCLGGSLCQEQPISSASWAFVGQGRGGYEKMAAYNYVGAGRGSYERETTTSFYGWRIRKCCLCVLAVVPVCFLGGLFLTMRSDEGSTTTTTTAIAMASLLNLSTTPPPELPKTTTTTTSPKPYDCDEGEPTDWSPGQLRWCCDKEEIGCEATTPPPPPEEQTVDGVALGGGAPAGDQQPGDATAEFECKEGEDFLKWTVPHRVFCCVNHRMGCPTTPPPVPPPPLPDPSAPKEGCFGVCSFQGHTSTCTGHIQWAAQTWYASKPNACEVAYGLLLQHCPACSSCTLTQTQCRQPTTTPPAPEAGAVLSTSAKAGAVPSTTANAPGLPSTSPGAPAGVGGNSSEFDCGAPDVDSWSIVQRVFCCKEHNVACPTPPPGGEGNTPSTTPVADKSKKANGTHHGHKVPHHNASHNKSNSVPHNESHNASHSWPAKPSLMHNASAADPAMPASPTDPGMPADPASNTSEEFEFNCEKGFSDWQQAWSQEQQEWCCEHQGLGCWEDKDQGAAWPPEQAATE